MSRGVIFTLRPLGGKVKITSLLAGKIQVFVCFCLFVTILALISVKFPENGANVFMGLSVSHGIPVKFPENGAKQPTYTF